MDIYGISEIDIEEYADMFLAPEQKDKVNCDETIKQVVSQLPKSFSSQPLGKFSHRIHNDNRKPLMSKITAEGSAEMKRIRDGTFKGKVEVSCGGQTKDGTGRADATITADSDGNVAGKLKVKKDFE